MTRSVLAPALVAGLAVAGLAVAGLATASPAAADRDDAVMTVSGGGGGRLGPEWGGLEGDPVSFEIDARGTDPMKPSGTFHVVHRKPDGSLLAEFSGRVTTLKTVDEVGVLTGVIEAAEHPDLPLEFVGKPVAFTVHDGGEHDRIGWVWGFFGAPVNPLQGTAPQFPLTSGDFRVRSAPASSSEKHRGPDRVSLTADPARGTTVAALFVGDSRLPDGPVRLELAGHVAAGDNPTQVTGGFQVHRRSGLSDFKGRITCLIAGGPVAMATGVVTESDRPEEVGKPVSFALKDGTIDRVSWLWGFPAAGPAPVVDCQSTVPAHTPRHGGVLVD